MTISSNIVLLGTHTTDLIQGKLYTSGGIANVARNLTQEFEYIPIQYASVDVYPSASRIQRMYTTKEALNIVPPCKWMHIAYIDWLNFTPNELLMLRSLADILTADVASFNHDLENIERLNYVDLLFCSEGQSHWLKSNLFIHSVDGWKIGDETYRTKPINLDFTTGAGDTLVACIMNNISS